MQYTVIDIESTGGAFKEEGIIEIALLRYDGNRLVDRFHSLVNPERPIQPFVSKLTGITANMLSSAPKFYQIAKRIIEISDDAILVAHNTQFDYRILRLEFERLGYIFERETLCTVELSQKLLPEVQSYKLGKLTKELGIPLSDRHRALGDAEATLELLKILLQKDVANQACKQLTYTKSESELSPSHVNLVRACPEESGVYYLYNQKSELIECGFAQTLKNHISTLLSSSSKEDQSVYKSVKSIRTEICISLIYCELHAFQVQLLQKPKKRFHLDYDSKPLSEIGPSSNYLIIDKGRTIGEKSVLWIKDYKLKAYGFVDLNYQITHIPILENRLSPPTLHSFNERIIAYYLQNKAYEIKDLT